MTFDEEVRALIGQYNGDVEELKNSSTIDIFTKALKNPTWQVQPTNISNMRKGCFYIIRYDYNGNKIWCPIFTLDFKIKENKNILFCINFDYLPYEYKISFVAALFKTNSAKISKNRDIQNAVQENSINMTLEGVYRWLQSNGKKEFSMTAFDVLKIDKVYAISTSIMHRFIFLDTTYINRRMMLDTLEHQDLESNKIKMKEKIVKFDEILELYKSDIEKYYKALRSFESNLKLTEE